MELTDAQKEECREELLETTDYVSFEMHYKVDPDLIGGMVIRIGDRVVDSSVVKTKIYKSGIIERAYQNSIESR